MERQEKILEELQRLAIDGGTPERMKPIAPWPLFAEDEAVAAVPRAASI